MYLRAEFQIRPCDPPSVFAIWMNCRSAIASQELQTDSPLSMAIGYRWLNEGLRMQLLCHQALG